MLDKYHVQGVDLGKLIAFRAVAEEASFRGAALRLRQAQPAVSRQIQALERALECRLFERDTSGTRLTAAGSELLAGLPVAFRELENAFDNAKAASLGMRGRLRIGCTIAAINTYLPRVLGDYRERFSEVSLSLLEQSSAEQLVSVESGKIDCGFRLSVGEPLAEGLASRDLFSEKVGLVLPASHVLAQQESVEVEALGDLPFIAFSRAANPDYHDLLIGFLKAKGANVENAEMWGGRLQAIGRVGAGMGFTSLSRSLAHLCGAVAVYRPIRGEGVPSITHQCVWNKGFESPALANFLEQLGSLSFENPVR